MWQVILLVVGVVMATIGTVMIYDARILTRGFLVLVTKMMHH